MRQKIERYRQRAEEIRRLVHYLDTQDKELLKELAAEYEEMANKAEMKLQRVH